MTELENLTSALPDPLAAAVRASLTEWREQDKVRRLWDLDASLWSGADEARWLGWLGIPGDQLAGLQRLTRASEAARSGGFTHVLLLGMGGSSLGPEVMAKTFGTIAGCPQLHVLDSTDPAQVRTFEHAVDFERTLFIVSSKSGTTLEPNIFKEYFFDCVAGLVGRKEAGSRFVAITDPGSKMQEAAERDGFRHVFFGWPSIGGRYSVLSDFGLVPAAIMGVDLARFLARTMEMVSVCMPSVPVEENPGVVLGTILGVAGRSFGRDKVTVVASPGILDLGAWLEQLVAESTGKAGTGLIPIDREPLGAPDVYGRDRLFVYLKLLSAPDAAQDALVDALERAGHPLVRIALDDPYDLGREFFRWEMATAVAGSILGINPFDQPDVEASKVATRQLTEAYEKTGALPAETPIATSEGIALFTDARNAAALARAAGGDRTLRGYLEGASGPGRRGRLPGAAGVRGDERGARAGAAGNATGRPRREARGHMRAVRPAIPALDGAGLQGRSGHRRIPADHVRRRRRPAGARPDVHLRRRQGGPGAGRFPGPRGPRTPCAARPPRRRRGSRPAHAAGRHRCRLALEPGAAQDSAKASSGKQ